LKTRKAISARTSRILSAKIGDPVVEIDPRYFRPTEVDDLIGDASRARKSLGWEPKVNFKELVKIMVDADLKLFNLVNNVSQVHVPTQPGTTGRTKRL